MKTSLRISLALFSLSLASLPAQASVAAPATGSLEQVDLFVAGQDGIFQYRIPGIIASNQGTLIAFCDGRMKRAGDPPNDIDLVMKRSTDGGRTWSPLRTLFDNGKGAAADSCGLVDRQTGRLWIFSVYAPEGYGSANVENGVAEKTFQFKAVTSDDDGVTWSQPVDYTPMVKKPTWGAGSTGVGSGIQTRAGRLVLPRYNADYREPRTTPTTSDAFVCYSDDHGKTWTMGAPAKVEGGTNECQVAELSDGTLLLNMRGLAGDHRKSARSHDGGATWTDIREEPALIEPRCQGSLFLVSDTVTGDRNRLVFSNPASLTRDHMRVRISYDEGRTWSDGKLLHEGPAAYSCLAVLPDKTVCCLYERGDKNPYEKITFARFDLAWLTDGKDAAAKKP
jgi:sialidase-1